MAEIFSELASMPRSEMIKPSSIPLGTPKTHFSGFKLNVVCSEFCKGLPKVGYDLISPFGLDHDVVHVGLNGSPNEPPETFEHTMLVHSPRIFRPNDIVT